MPTTALKLVALDAEDLAVVSACVQDAVLQVGDIRWKAGERRFVVVMNRFAWETGEGGEGYQRRRACLHFDRVLAVRSQRVPRALPDSVQSLLAVTFQPSEAPAGTIELIFAGGGAIRLEVECIEAQLADLGAIWEAQAKPAHDDD